MPYYQVLSRSPWKLAAKRIADIVLSAVLLIALLPLFLLLCLMIHISSPGPCIFAQERLTRYGKPFTIYKLRTMREDAGQEGPQVTVEDDQRVTALGRFLRRLRLDELPQLINILLGDMSFVGTRPESPRYAAHYLPEYWATLLLPAGLTSRASILFKDEAQLLSQAGDPEAIYIARVLPEKMKYNLASLQRFSLKDELLVLLSTGLAVLGAPVHRWLGPAKER